jgi:hypothetical protein
MLAPMGRGSHACASALAIAWLVACDPAAPDDSLSPAAALLADVRAADYRGWARPPEWPERAAGRAPHGFVSDVFIDPTTVAALERGEPITAWPEGSTLVCDGFADAAGESLVAIQIMRKTSGAWTWAQYAADDTPLVDAAGRSSLACSHCHAAGADFVRTLAFPE